MHRYSIPICFALLIAVGPISAQSTKTTKANKTPATVDSATSASRARAPALRRRFWGELGVSNGAAALTCTICRGERANSFAGQLSLGAPVGKRTILGLSLDGWMYVKSGVKERVYAVSPIAQFYPLARHPAFVRLGLGLSRFVAVDGEDNLTSTSVGAQLRAGYEFRLTPNYVLVPSVGLLRGAGGTLQFNGERVANASSGVSLMTYGLAVALR